MSFATSEAKKEYQQQYYQKNREKLIEASKQQQKDNPKRKAWSLEYYRNKRKERKEWMATLKSSMKCLICSEKRIACLEFHHRDPGKKEKAISAILKEWSKKRILAEIAKCDVFCKNCHAVFHWEENNL